MRTGLRMFVCLTVGALALGLAVAEPMDMLAALAQGKIEATFYGNGDESVRGRIRTSTFGPDEITVAPGTQFWAQQEGLQGMTTLGWVPIDLRGRPFVIVEIPTACTNYDLPAPSRWDKMIPYCCPSPKMAALTSAIGRVQPSRPVVQLAVWAVANNPTWQQVLGYAEGKATSDNEEEQAAQVLSFRQQTAQLLTNSGIDLSDLRMFAE